MGFFGPTIPVTNLTIFCLAYRPEVEILSEQKISCEGCGSKWAFVGVGSQIVARLVECPLCSEEKLE